MQNAVPLWLKPAYRLQSAAIRYPLIVAQGGLRFLGRREPPDPRLVIEVRQRHMALLDTDVANVKAGYYEASTLFRRPFGDYLRAMPALLEDLPRIYKRSQERRYDDLPADGRAANYPRYYQRTFHWQSDGYLSRSSARKYDLGVELVFLGSGDAMRRQVIPPLVDALADQPGARILDVACGTGRTLEQLSRAMPKARLTGLDLSPYYLAEARRRLAETVDVSFVAENAEQLPFADNWFSGITSVFLFHELPRAVRRRVLSEMYRALAPGGVLVLEDSIQDQDAPALGFFMHRFADELHEPFYRDYVGQPLEDMVTQAGFEYVETRQAFMAKVVIARKPR